MEDYKAKMKVEHGILLVLAFVVSCSFVSSVAFSYSIPLLWIRNETGHMIDTNKNGMVDETEMVNNLGSALEVSNGKLSISQGKGIVVGNNSIEIDSDYLEDLGILTFSRRIYDENYTDLDTIKPDGDKRLEVISVDNDTYEGGQNKFNLIHHTQSAPIYLRSVEVETETGTELTRESQPCSNCYSIDACNGKVNITDLNTTVGDNETVVIKYRYAPVSESGGKDKGILQTSQHPLRRYEVVNSHDGTTDFELADTSFEFEPDAYYHDKDGGGNYNTEDEVFVDYDEDGVYTAQADNLLAGSDSNLAAGDPLTDADDLDTNWTGATAGDMMYYDDSDGNSWNSSSDAVWIDNPGGTADDSYNSADDTLLAGTEPTDGTAKSGDGLDTDWSTIKVYDYTSGDNWNSSNDALVEDFHEGGTYSEAAEGINAGEDGSFEITDGTPGNALPKRYYAADVDDSGDINLGDEVIKNVVRLEDQDGNILSYGRCNNFTISDAQTGKIKLWRFNKTNGNETVETDYSWTDFGDEVYWNASGQSVDINKSIITTEVKDRYVNVTGDVMTGDLNMSGNAINNLTLITLQGKVFALVKDLDLTSNYLLKDSPSVKSVPIGYLSEYWPFERGKGSVSLGWKKGFDMEFESREGALPEWSDSGKLGRSIDFSPGEGYLSAIGHVTESDTTTLSAWVKISSGTENQTLISIGDCIELKGIVNSSAGAGLFCNNTYDYRTTRFNTSIDDGSWHHLAYVKGDGKQTVYIDGQVDGITHYTEEIGLDPDQPDIEVAMNTLLGASWSKDWPYSDKWTISNRTEWQSAEEEDQDVTTYRGKLELEKFWWLLGGGLGEVHAYDRNWEYTGVSQEITGHNIKGIVRNRSSSNFWAVTGSKVYKYNSDWDFQSSKSITEDNMLTDIFLEKDNEWRLLGMENDKVYKYDRNWNFENEVYIGEQDKNATGLFQGREDNIWRMLGNKTDTIYEYETLGVSVAKTYSSPDSFSTGIYQSGQGNWWVIGADSDKIYKYNNNFTLQNSYNIESETQQPEDIEEEISSEGNWTSIWYDWEEWVKPDRLDLWVNSTGGSLQVRVETSYDKSQVEANTTWMEVKNIKDVSFNISELGKARYVRILFNLTRGQLSPRVENYSIKVKKQGKEEFWNGQLDEARIYNKALSQNQVRTLYEKGRKDKQEIGGAWLSREGGKLYGDLDMNDNSIENFFSSPCDVGDVLIGVGAGGTQQCRGISGLGWVNEGGDEMTGNLIMKYAGESYNITGVQRLGINTTQSDYGALQINYEGDSSTISGTHPISIRGHDQALLLGADTDNTAGYLQSIDIGTDKSNLTLNPQGGNVGIGVTNPSTKLEVGGPIILSNNNYLSWTGSGGGVRNVIKLDSSNDLIINGINDIRMSGSEVKFTDGSTTAMKVDMANGGIDMKSNFIKDLKRIKFDNRRIEIGGGSTGNVDNPIAIGEGAEAPGNEGLAIGTNARVSWDGGTAIGKDAEVTNYYAMALGKNADSNDYDEIEVGSSSQPYDLRVHGEISGMINARNDIKGDMVRIERYELTNSEDATTNPGAWEPSCTDDYNWESVERGQNFDTDINASDWECTVFDGEARGGDINEWNPREYGFYAYTYPTGTKYNNGSANDDGNTLGWDTWHIQYDFGQFADDGEVFKATLLCINSTFVETRGEDYGKYLDMDNDNFDCSKIVSHPGGAGVVVG